MSYTPPAGDAASFDFSALAGYVPPTGGAADFDFSAGSALQGLAAAPSPLGAPALLAASVRAAWASAPSVLGSPAVLGRAFELVQAQAAAPSMLSEPAALGTVGNSYLGWASAPSPLGAPAAVARPVLAGWVALPGPLGAAAVLARQPVHGRVAVPGVLGAPTVVGAVSAAETPDVVTLISDDFNSGVFASRPIGSSIDPGATWVPSPGYESALVVGDGVLYSTTTGEYSPGGQGAVWTYPGTAPHGDFVVEVGVKVRTSTGLRRIGINTYWWSDEAWTEYDDIYFGVGHDTTGFYSSGSYISYSDESGFIGEGDGAHNIASLVAGDSFVVRFERRGGIAKVFVADVLVASLAGTGTNPLKEIDFSFSGVSLDSVNATSVVEEVFSGHVASGWQATQFGTPYGANAYRAATIGEVVRFGTPTTPTYTEHQAQGFNHTRFGTPYGLLPFEFAPVNQSTNARGWMVTQFGTPAGQANLSGQAQGWQAAQFGAPRYTAVLSVESLGTLTQFGTPTAGSGHRVHGFRATQFGAPTCAAGYLAQGFNRTRFGTPRGSLPGALVARGWCGTRFGTPRGSLPPPGYAAESFSATQFGVPTATIRHRAATLGPLSRFGRPTLRRNPTC